MIILNTIQKLSCETVVTIGNFDGIHIGHMKLIQKTKVMAKKISAKSLVFSFCPHTLQILKDPALKTIFTKNERRFILDNLDIDYFLEYPFDKAIAKINSLQFFNLLIKNLNCRTLVLGNDYKFGHDKTNSLPQEFKNRFIKILDDVTFENKKLSSTYIRSLILEKNFVLAEKLLGRKFFVMPNEPVHLQKKFPSAINLDFVADKNKLLPPTGIYFTSTIINKHEYKSLTTISHKQVINNKFNIVNYEQMRLLNGISEAFIQF